MLIILPNNTEELPSVWDTEKDYEQQTEMAKEYACSLFNGDDPIIEIDGRRPIIKIFDDSENNIRIIVTTNYKYDINNKACFVIYNESVVLENT